MYMAVLILKFVLFRLLLILALATLEEIITVRKIGDNIHFSASFQLCTRVER